jgi:DNA-binding transcriptional LysR family regulator
MWESVELLEIRVSLALAEELHFGRTAERMGLTQSRVSQTIRRLEAKLGAPLFHRTSRHVTLTPFGERLLAEVRAPLDQLARVLRDADAPGAITGPLRLALLSPPSGGPYLAEISIAFERRHSGSRVALSHADLSDPLGQLRRGDIDLLAARLPIEQPDITIGPILSREDRALAVARDHPLAQRQSVTLDDLADYAVAQFDTELKEMIEALIPLATPGGRPIPRAPVSPRSLPEVFTLVARGVIVHPTVPSLGDYVAHPNVVLVPLTGMPVSETALIWLKRADRRIRAFLDVARGILPY